MKMAPVAWRRRLRKYRRRGITRARHLGASDLSEEGVSLGLTASQVAKVIAQASADAEGAELLAGLARPEELASSPLLNDRTIARSLLFGLVVLICFPADGSERGVKELARELDLPRSTTHRYIHTLHVVGLLEQDPLTRRYRRARRLGLARGSG
jgi:hypothetical protein